MQRRFHFVSACLLLALSAGAPGETFQIGTTTQGGYRYTYNSTAINAPVLVNAGDRVAIASNASHPLRFDLSANNSATGTPCPSGPCTYLLGTNAASQFSFHCLYHGSLGMRATIAVQPNPDLILATDFEQELVPDP